MFNTINFCYWAKPGELKWTITDGNLDGAVALFVCLENALKQDSDFLKPSKLAKISLEELRKAFEGKRQMERAISQGNH